MATQQQFPSDENHEGTGTAPRRSGGLRRIAAPLATVALIGAASAGTVAYAAPDSAAQATGTPTCATSGLSASLGENLAGGMMHEGAVLKLKNTTDHSCALRGYPGLGLEDSEHNTLASDVTWGDTYYAQDPGKKTLTLEAGQSAESVIAWSHANTGTSDAQHAAYLVVTPPASTTHKTLKLDTWVDNGDLDVTPVAYSYDVTG